MILPPLSAQPPMVAAEEINSYEMTQSIVDTYMLAPPYFCNLRKSEVERIASLGDNWDGEGAKPINEAVVSNVMTMIGNMSETLLEQCNIYPLSYGNICLDFGEDGHMVSLECGRTKIGLFTDFEEGGNVVLEDVPCAFENIPDKVYEQLIRLYPQHSW